MNRMKSDSIVYTLTFIVAVILIQCNPKTTATISNTAEQTDECLLKEEVCAEALDFQKEYDRLPEEQQKDMLSVLSTYVTHCEEATKRCEESMKKRKKKR